MECESEVSIPSWSYLLSDSSCTECISLAKLCVSTAQQICCAAELRLQVLMRSREEVSCQWGQYFHIVIECEENGSSEETGTTFFKTEKGQKDTGRKDDKMLGRKKAVFQDGSTNPSKTTNEFCWVSKPVRRYNRLRWCSVAELSIQYYVSNRST